MFYYPTFVADLVGASGAIKREVRCNSGAIPVAVSSASCIPGSQATVYRQPAGWEGKPGWSKPEDLPYLNNIQLSGERHEM